MFTDECLSAVQLFAAVTKALAAEWKALPPAQQAAFGAGTAAKDAAAAQQ